MTSLVELMLNLLWMNAVIAFIVTFIFQIVLVFRLRQESTRNGQLGIGNSNSEAANGLRFLKGELWPDLRKKWLRSLLWLISSLVVLSVCSAIYLQP